MAIPSPAAASRLNFLTSNVFSGQTGWTANGPAFTFNNGFSTDALVIVGRALCTGTNSATLGLQLSTAGAVDSGSHYAYAVNGAPYASGTQANIAQSAGTTTIQLAPAIATNAAASTVSFYIYIWSPFDTTSTKNISWSGTVALTSTTGQWFVGGSTWTQTSAIDGFAITASSGNINTGQISVYQLMGQ